MTELQKMMLSYIPSETMRGYLAEKLDSGEFAPSCEDMASTVFNFGRDVFRNADFYRRMLGEELSEDTRRELEWHVSMAENMQRYIENKNMRYAFVCGRMYHDEDRVFNSFRKAFKYMKRRRSYYAAVADKHIRTSDKFIAELVTDEQGTIIEANSYHSEWWSYPQGSFARRYVKYPVPFKAGDVVYFAGDGEKKLFCVIDAEQPEYSERLDIIDASMVVIPYEFREYAVPENIRAHYERLAERRRNGNIFYDDSTELDVISREHEHMGVLCAELWKENEYEQGN